MSRPELRIRRLRVLLPARLRATAAADARRIAEAAALAIHERARLEPHAAGAPGGLGAIELQGGNRPVAAIAHEVAGRAGAAWSRARRGRGS